MTKWAELRKNRISIVFFFFPPWGESFQMLEGGLRGTVWRVLGLKQWEDYEQPHPPGPTIWNSDKNHYKLSKRKSNGVLILPMTTMLVHYDISNIEFFKNWFLVALLAGSLQLPSVHRVPSTRVWIVIFSVPFLSLSWHDKGFSSQHLCGCVQQTFTEHGLKRCAWCWGDQGEGGITLCDLGGEEEADAHAWTISKVRAHHEIHCFHFNMGKGFM